MSFETLLQSLLFGLAGERPGGLVLTVIVFLVGGFGALVLGIAYGIACTASRLVALPLTAAGAALRGIPPILLIFALAHVPSIGLVYAGMAGIALYSFSHVGETIRAYLRAYPQVLKEAAQLAAVHPAFDWAVLRLGWTMRRSFPALVTHWISLLKDTGALVVVGIAELTTTAKLIADSTANMQAWMLVLAVAATLYLFTTLALIQGLSAIQRAIEPSRERGKARTTIAHQTRRSPDAATVPVP